MMQPSNYSSSQQFLSPNSIPSFEQGTEKGEAGESDNKHVRYLASSGKLLHKSAPTDRGGLVVAIRNHAVRNREWAISNVCFDQKTGNFALADERGQVYSMFIKTNSYQSVRLASTAVSAMCFVNGGRRNHLVVAYESGSMIILDTATKDIIGNLQLARQRERTSAARIVRCHPTQPILLVVCDDRSLALWDANVYRCVQSMECGEAIVDARFEYGGQLIALVLQYSGVFLYSAETLELLLHLQPPETETLPHWTTYCCIDVPMVRHYGAGPPQRRKSVAASQNAPRDLNIILAGNNSMLYSWYVRASELLKPDNTAAGGGRGGGGRGSQEEKQTHADQPNQKPKRYSYLVGVVELPLKNRVAVSLIPLGLGEHPARVIILSSEGGLLITEIHGFQSRSVGFFTILADLTPQQLYGIDSLSTAGWSPSAVGNEVPTLTTAVVAPTSTPTGSGSVYEGVGGSSSSSGAGGAGRSPVRRRSSVGSGMFSPAAAAGTAAGTAGAAGGATDISVFSGGPNSAGSGSGSGGGVNNGVVFGYTKDINGKLDASGAYFAVIGHDGAARLFSIEGAVGNGNLMGTQLRTRLPRSKSTLGPKSSFSGFVPPDAETLAAAAADANTLATTNTASVHNNTIPTTQQQPQQEHTHHYHKHHNNNHQVEQQMQTEGEFRGGADYDFVLHDDTEDFGAAIRKQYREKRQQNKLQQRTRVVQQSQQQQRGGGGRGTTRARTTTSSAPSSGRGRAQRTRSGNSHSGATVVTNGSSVAAAGKSSFMATNRALKFAHNVQDTANMPLFELAALTPKEKQVNLKKLKVFLNLNGEFPSRYRPLVWRFLLRLPENSTAFSDLVQKGLHPAFENLYDQYPIQAPKIFGRLQRVCSLLAHWSPIFADATYLPSLVFPITLVHGPDELASLETCMSILMWWGHSWHALHPNPPAHFMDSVDAILKFTDTKLYTHLKRLDVAPGVVGWTLISTLFTEVLSRTAWLKLMDFLFSHFDRIPIILLTPVAILRDLRASLLSTDMGPQVVQFLRTQQGVNVTTVVKSITDMMRNTPAKYFSAVATRQLSEERLELGPGHVSEMVNLGEVDQARENIALSNGKPIFPLTKGRYPIYDGFPQHLVDLQIRERNKILAMSKEETRRESVLHALQAKLHEIEHDHASWMAKHNSASEAEIAHQQDMMEQEKQHLRELHRIEEEISQQRIQSLEVLENAAKEEMSLMDKAAQESQRLLAHGEKHLKEKMELNLSVQKHRELAELAEVATHERIRQLQMRRIREDWVKNVASTLKGREEQLNARDALLNEKWKKEDDERHIIRDQRTSELRQLKEDERRAAVQEDLEMRMRRLEMERDAKVVDIERARAIRLAKEQAEEALQAQERSSLLLRRHETAAATEAAANMAEYGVKHAEEKLLETVAMVRNESEKMLDAEKAHALRQNKARVQAKQAELRKEWAEKSGQQLQSLLNSQGELQAQILKLQKASLRAEMDESFASAAYAAAHDSSAAGANPATASAQQEYYAAHHQLSELEDAVLQQQRQRFQEMQDYMKQEHEALMRQRMAGLHAAGGSAEGESMDAFFSKQGAPTWGRLPSDIPAPLSGAGIGYGITGSRMETGGSYLNAPAAAARVPPYLEAERDAERFALPVDEAVRIASDAAVRTTNSAAESGNSNSGATAEIRRTATWRDEVDVDLAQEDAAEDVDLGRTLHYRELQRGVQTTADRTRSTTHAVSTTSNTNYTSNTSSSSSDTGMDAATAGAWRRRGSGLVTAQSIHEDALATATAAEALDRRSGGGTTTRRSVSTEAYSSARTATADSNRQGHGRSMNAEDLRRLTEQSLKHLEATRDMNRNEVLQETQQNRDQQSSHSQPQSQAQSQAQSSHTRQRHSPDPTAGSRGRETGHTIATAAGNATDSDTALWAFNDEDEDSI